jgi:cbb3-type cytochrome oxidase cytochrome c subunit
MPQSGMVTRGARVYAANGCNYCHSEQVRADYAGADIERKWGDRRSAPRDYIFERPVLLGKMRMGQDLANIGARAPKEEESPSPTGGASPAPQGAAVSSPPPSAGSPAPASSPAAPAPAASLGSPAPKAPGSPAAAASPSSPLPGGTVAAGPSTGVASPSPAAAAKASAAASPATPPSPSAPWPEQTAGLPPMYSAAWHHVRLYSPRSINFDSNMPSYRFLYQARRISDARSSDALQLTGSDAPPEGWEIVPSYDAKCLVAYMMALNQSHPLKDVRSAGPAAAASPAVSPSPAPGGQPPK